MCSPLGELCTEQLSQVRAKAEPPRLSERSQLGIRLSLAQSGWPAVNAVALDAVVQEGNPAVQSRTAGLYIRATTVLASFSAAGATTVRRGFPRSITHLVSGRGLPSTGLLRRPTTTSQKRLPNRLTLWPLVAATFFMVSGGTYGTEDIVHGAGYARAIGILLVTPVVWSLPTTLMIGELASALPEEGGYYAWVRRGLGRFWGFEEAWLSLVASIFDMAIYPTLFLATSPASSPGLPKGIARGSWGSPSSARAAC